MASAQYIVDFQYKSAKMNSFQTILLRNTDTFPQVVFLNYVCQWEEITQLSRKMN